MPVKLQLSDAHFVKVFPPTAIHSSLEVCIAFNTVLPAQPTCPLPLPKHLGMHFCFEPFQHCLAGNTHIMVCASHTCYFGHLAYHYMFMFLGLKDLCDLPCGLFADRWDAFCNCPCRQLVDSMCKSVEVVHKLHTVVRILPEVECLDMLPKTDPMPKQCGCVHLQT